MPKKISDHRLSGRKAWIVWGITTVVLYILTAAFFHAKQLGLHYMLHMLTTGNDNFVAVWKEYFSTLGNCYQGIYGERRKLVFGLLEFLALHFFVPIKSLYQFIFKFRYLVGLALLCFMVINRYHGDSMGAFDQYVEPGMGSEFTAPVLGQTRAIRSDEWAITTPGKISSSYGEQPYGRYNELLRGGDTLNMICGIYVGYSTIGKNIFQLFYGILGVEYAFSLAWYGPIFLTFLVSLEFFLILTKKKQLPAVAGSCLVTFSSFYQWWGFPAMIWTMEACLVCFYYLLNTSKLWKKCLLGIGFAISFSGFCTILYPAWQVPFGYAAIALAIWMMIENWEKIKALRWKDYLVIVGMLAFAGSLLFSYLHETSEYITAIGQTVYPGVREETGSFYLQKFLYYFIAPFYPYHDIGNASEYSVFLSLFPLPLIMGCIQWFKDRKNNKVNLILLIVALFFLCYVTVGLPYGIAKATMLTYCTPARMVDAIGYLQVILMVRLLAAPQWNQKEKNKKVMFWCALTASVITVAIAAVYCKRLYPHYISWFLFLGAFGVFVIIAVGICLYRSRWIKVAAMYMIIAVSLFTGLTVRPVMKGFDAIWSKPVAVAIQNIVANDPDGLWIGSGDFFIYPSFLVACGAKTENSNNTYPDMELFTQLDPMGEYEEIYNRYSHVQIELTEDVTSFELVAPDSILIHLNEAKLLELGVDYMMTNYELTDTQNCRFTNLYSANGVFLYHVMERSQAQ